MAYKLQPGTGALFDPSTGFGSTFAGDSKLPRSIASDGRRWVLLTHVLVHVVALSFNVISAVYFYGDFVQSQMRVGAIVAVVMHGLGILALLALAAAEMKQLAYVVGMSLILSFLLSALCATVGMMVFTFRSDDKLTEPCVCFARTFNPHASVVLCFERALCCVMQALDVLRFGLLPVPRPGLCPQLLLADGVQGRRRDRRQGRAGTRGVGEWRGGRALREALGVCVCVCVRGRSGASKLRKDDVLVLLCAITTDVVYVCKGTGHCDCTRVFFKRIFRGQRKLQVCARHAGHSVLRGLRGAVRALHG